MKLINFADSEKNFHVSVEMFSNTLKDRTLPTGDNHFI